MAVVVDVVKVVTFFRVLRVVRVVRFSGYWDQDRGGWGAGRLTIAENLRRLAFPNMYRGQGYPVNPHVQRI